MIKGRVLYETHMHTPLCHHAKGRPEEYAQVGEERGLKGIIVTCHNPMPNGYGNSTRMTSEDFPRYLDLVARARDAMAGRMDVRLGMECDYFPGAEKFLSDQLELAEFNYILGSVHPHVPEYQAMFWNGNALEYQATYFHHLACAAESKLFDALAHPDLVKNYVPTQWNFERILDTVRRSLDRIAASGTAMELNTSGLNKEIAEMNPGTAILREMRERDIQVVVGADAHVPNRVGDNFKLAFKTLLDVGYTHTTIFLNRQPHQIPLSEAVQSLIG